MFGSNIAQSQFYARKDDTFTFFNPFLVPVTLGILASDWVAMAYPSITKVVPVFVPNPKQYSDYVQLVYDKENNPKNIKGVRLLFESFSYNQFKNPFQWVTQDSNGSFKAFVDHPLNLLALDQYQDRLVDIYYHNLVNGANQWLAYKLNALTRVTMTFVYDDFSLGDLLEKDNPRQVIYSKKAFERFEKLL